MRHIKCSFLNVNLQRNKIQLHFSHIFNIICNQLLLHLMHLIFVERNFYACVEKIPHHYQIVLELSEKVIIRWFIQENMAGELKQTKQILLFVFAYYSLVYAVLSYPGEQHIHLLYCVHCHCCTISILFCILQF